jgi:HEPN domain-containing protein/predicted nucleotidyltransferase
MIRAAEVMDERLEAMTRLVVAEWAPRRVILFGSRARRKHRTDSDYDLMIVIDSPGSVDACEREIRERVSSADAPVDVCVVSTRSFERRRLDVGTLEYAADREGVVLYDGGSSDAPLRVREGAAVPESFGEWRERAENDYSAMLRAMGAPPIPDAAGFHAHQCAEKYLKAGLILIGVQPPRTHVLTALLASSDSRLQLDVGVARGCALLDDLYPKTRYPKERPPTVQEADRAAEAAGVIRTAAVEPAAAALAAGCFSREELKKIDALARVGYSVTDRASIREFLKVNREFHGIIASACGNERLAALVDQLHLESSRVFQVQLINYPDPREHVELHRQLAAALRAGNGEEARDLCEREIKASRRFILDSFLTSPALRGVDLMQAANAAPVRGARGRGTGTRNSAPVRLRRVPSR